MPMPIHSPWSLQKNPNFMKHIMKGSKENHIISILISIIEPKLILEELLGDLIPSLSIKEVSNTTYTFLKKS